MRNSIAAILILVATATATAACSSFSIDEPRAPEGSGGSATTSSATTGAGTPACDPGSHACAGTCVDDASPSGCGASCVPCDAVPNATPTCNDASCGFACAPGFADCDGNPANGCEADLASAATCGSCKTACAAPTPFCKGEVCSSDCGASPMVVCGTSCVDITTDPQHCGGCATSCPADPNGTAICQAGLCDVTCVAGYHACAGVCVSDTSVATCGAACSPCSAPANGAATCDGSSCGTVCTGGYVDCDGNAANGCEADLATPATCGTCGTVCSGATPLCKNTGGVYSCASTCGGAAPTLCGASCVNTTNDPNNCGACNNACPAVTNATATCNGGSCGHVCNAGYQACGGVCSNSLGTACSTGQPGICAVGTIACSGGSLVCVQSQQPAAETCDTVDNNCNGQIDEGNPGGGAACAPGGNVCKAGAVNCSSGALVCGYTGNVAAGSPCGPGHACDGAGTCCDSKLGTHGQTVITQSAISQYVFHDGWCSIPWKYPAQCVAGTFIYSQSVASATCTSVGSTGACNDNDAQWTVVCNASVDCIYDCNGVCNPTSC